MALRRLVPFVRSVCATNTGLLSCTARPTAGLVHNHTVVGFRYNLPRVDVRTAISSSAAAHKAGSRDESGQDKKFNEDEPSEFHPTAKEAAALPYDIDHLPHEVLLIAAINGNHDARQEVLTRNIMAVDGVDWHTAAKTAMEIKLCAQSGNWLGRLPYQVGFVVATTVGLGSIPLCFHLDTVLAFNDAFVTCDPPEEGDVDTWLEVGSYSWNWMEPPLGQASFGILCAQLATSALLVLGFAPNGDWMSNMRARRVVAEYPQYNERVLRDYATSNLLRD